MSKLKSVTFNVISAPDFKGELETLSVKIPNELKQLLTTHGDDKDRTLTEVVVHVLTQYGLQIRDTTSSIKTRVKSKTNSA